MDKSTDPKVTILQEDIKNNFELVTRYSMANETTVNDLDAILNYIVTGKYTTNMVTTYILRNIIYSSI